MSDAPIQIAAVRVLIERHGAWWVPLDTYLAQYPGETEDSVYSRRYKGVWRDGIECKKIRGAGLWVNIVAVNTWAASAESRPVSLPDSTATGKRSASA